MNYPYQAYPVNLIISLAVCLYPFEQVSILRVSYFSNSSMGYEEAEAARRRRIPHLFASHVIASIAGIKKDRTLTKIGRVRSYWSPTPGLDSQSKLRTLSNFAAYLPFFFEDAPSPCMASMLIVSAIRVSRLSVSPSSFSVCCKVWATRSRPSS